MKKIKVMTVVGTRPEIIRLSSVIKKLDHSESIEHILVHSGQNYDYELNEIFFKDFNLNKPKYFLNAAGSNSMETIGKIIIETDRIIKIENPDAFLILGDTNSCLSAIAAKRKKVPIFHMEAGNRCFDQRVPEETNRKIVDHISDINLPYSSIAREYLLREGFPSDQIIKTGSPMFEVIDDKKNEINESDILSKLSLERRKYFLVSTHREENIETKNFYMIIEILNKIAQIYKLPIILSTHPRTLKMIQSKKVKIHKLIKIIKPLGFIEYNKLQLESKLVISDSGTISEESSILKFNAINLREAHERPEAMEEGVVPMSGVNIDRVLQCIKTLDNFDPSKISLVKDYSQKNVSNKILKIILSYVDYINKKVWKKDA